MTSPNTIIADMQAEIDALRKRVSIHYKESIEAATVASSYAEDALKLRAFAQSVMSYWPDGSPDGGDLQEIAENNGLLKQEIRHEPCGENCACNDYVSSGTEWSDGITCYRRTLLLTGTGHDYIAKGWISCNDRMPEDRVKVLCAMTDGSIEVLSRKANKYPHDPLWYGRGASYIAFIAAEKQVTHWMPLPWFPSNGNLDNTKGRK